MPSGQGGSSSPCIGQELFVPLHFLRIVQLSTTSENCDHIGVVTPISHAPNLLLGCKYPIEVVSLVVLVVEQSLRARSEEAMPGEQADYKVVDTGFGISAVGNSLIYLLENATRFHFCWIIKPVYIPRIADIVLQQARRQVVAVLPRLRQIVVRWRLLAQFLAKLS